MGEIEDRLERLAAHRAAQIPEFSMPTAEELVVRRHGTRRAPLIGAIAACLVVALVIGGWLLASSRDDPLSVQTSAGRPTAGGPTGLPAAGAAGGCAGKAYVNNSRDGTVSVITTATGAVSGTIALGATPIGPAITPDGRHVYVSNHGALEVPAAPGDLGTVSVITTATGAVSAPITVGSGPAGIGIAPDGQHVYVANQGDGTVSVITAATGAVSATIKVGTIPVGPAITPDGKQVYVANQIDGTVSVITTATDSVSATIKVGKAPGGVAITPDGKHVFVANNGDGTLQVITTTTGAVSAPIAVGKGPQGMAVTPDGTHVYVANNGDATVSVIETATSAVSARVPVGNGPVGVAITPDGRDVYVANNGDGTVSVITTATAAVSAPVPVGNGPRSVAICPP